MSVATQPTEKLYLKVEAVNIYATILDTSQLSVIRGSSNIIKNAIEELSNIEDLREKKSDIEGKLIPITTGGSIGIFKMENAVDQDKLICTVREFLTKSVGGLGKYFTFVVNTVTASTYLEAKEALIALGRHSQLNQLSLPAPGVIDNPNGICAYNGFLPTVQKSQLPNTANENASESVNQRFQKGRKLRTSIYFEGKDKSSNEAQYQLSQDLHQLAGTHPTLSLNGKIAVIYADGNSFGKIQREAIENACKQGSESSQEDAQKSYDDELKKIRQDYQKRLIDLFVTRQPELKGNEKTTPIQVETLLWGGDESTIVVPAWLGFDVLQHFFEHHKNKTLNGHPITFSAGMVLCSAKTPIQKAQQLAIELADNIKEQPNGRQFNLFDYAVLESIDYFVEDSIEDFWKKQFHTQAKCRRPIGYQESASLDEALKAALDALPRHRVYYFVKTFLPLPVEAFELQENLTPERVQEQKMLAQKEHEAQQLENTTKFQHRTQLVNNIYTDLVNGLNAESKDILEKLGSIFQYLPKEKKKEKKNKEEEKLAHLTHENPYFWIHLLELYDYLAPEAPNNSNTQHQSEEQ
ncbi:hypothetical protein Q8W40_18625 [Vibrio penaeicida]|uniref:Cas10/Cmr2 second palm domain-containing protein n=1 Tax=Vibrio penaeicida TaxID=104609 RepID=UPI002736A363|nr:hypothetical protein [Vibrio penaeicida]MDP2574212.1 hypothetical protein [Vibrio penaeicida]